MSVNNLKDSDLILVGYTNGDQILYANEDGEGLFFSNTDNDCFIPLYILKAHAHRIESTSKTGFNSEKLKQIKGISVK